MRQAYAEEMRLKQSSVDQFKVYSKEEATMIKSLISDSAIKTALQNAANTYIPSSTE
jgi:hypothetical protein